MSDRIGIYGGSFDPVHLGHARVAETVGKKLSLSKIMIIPTYVSPLKKSLTASSEDRLNMCRLQFTEDSFEVSDIELRRRGKSFTFDTVTELKTLYPKASFSLLMGSDQILQFHKWYKFDELAGLVSVVSFTRDAATDKKKLSEYCSRYLPETEWDIIEYEPIEISSTVIRNSLANGTDCSKFLSPQVLSYIKEKGLYLENR